MWHVDQAVAHEIAAAYRDEPNRRSSLSAAAFTQLTSETDELFGWLTQPTRRGALQVFFTTCEHPYRDAEELVASVRRDHVLEVTTVAADSCRRHPILGNERGGAYDRFRAVHDAVGHARMRLGFDRDADFTVWLMQERSHSPLARWVLASELHGQHSVHWTTGDVAEPKAVLLDPLLLNRSRRYAYADEAVMAHRPFRRGRANEARQAVT